METKLESSKKWGTDRHNNYHRAKWISDEGILQKIVVVAQVKSKNGTVVDFGCGQGNQLEAFARQGFQCIGIDSDPNMLERAIRHQNIKYILSPIQEVKGLTADIIVARNVLHYIPGPILSEVAWKALKPGGIAILAQAVPPSTQSRLWHNNLHDLLNVNHAPSSDDMVSFLRLAHFADIRADFSFHRMNVNEWLDARSDSPLVKQAALEHHGKLVVYPEYEPSITSKQIDVTVRFAIVSGHKNER